MTIFIIIFLIFIIVTLIGITTVLVMRSKSTDISQNSVIVKEILDKHEFVIKRIYHATNELALAINKKENKLALIETPDPINADTAKYYTIPANFITGIEKTSFGINITYINNGNKNVFIIPTKNKEIEQLIHDVYKNAVVKKLADKYSISSFKYIASSDWACEYVWAYNSMPITFAYYKTTGRKAIYKLNLLKEFFTIDVKFNYFEAPVMGIAQQLNIYEPSFLNDIFISLLNIIKQKHNIVWENKIYFDSYNEIVYLTNGTTSMQSALLKQVEEVYYKPDKIVFSLMDSEKVINYPADKLMIEKFEEFITDYNLSKISKSFDYTTDKLINTTEGTKFIIDYSRDRVVYCAGLTSLAKFSYLNIMFSNLESATVEKSKENYFVRIYTKDKNIIDVSCKKNSVAQYILAQILTIINL